MEERRRKGGVPQRGRAKLVAIGRQPGDLFDGRIVLTFFSNTCCVGTTNAPVFWSKLYIWSYFSANGFIHS